MYFESDFNLTNLDLYQAENVHINDKHYSEKAPTSPSRYVLTSGLYGGGGGTSTAFVKGYPELSVLSDRLVDMLPKKP